MGRGQPAGGPGSIRNTKVRVHRFAKIALYTRSRIYVEVFKGTSHVLEAAVPGRVAPAAVLGVTGSTGHCPARRRGVRRRRPAGWRRRRSGSACRDRRAAASHGTPGRALGGPLATLQERERVRRALRLSWPPPGTAPSARIAPTQPRPRPPTRPRRPAPYRAPQATHQLPDCSGESSPRSGVRHPRPGPLALPQNLVSGHSHGSPRLCVPGRVPLGLAPLRAALTPCEALVSPEVSPSWLPSPLAPRSQKSRDLHSRPWGLCSSPPQERSPS